MLPPSPRDFKDIYVVFELMETDLHQVCVLCCAVAQALDGAIVSAPPLSAPGSAPVSAPTGRCCCCCCCCVHAQLLALIHCSVGVAAAAAARTGY
jgi:hypothetical protein